MSVVWLVIVAILGWLLAFGLGGALVVQHNRYGYVFTSMLSEDQLDDNFVKSVVSQSRLGLCAGSESTLSTLTATTTGWRWYKVMHSSSKRSRIAASSTASRTASSFQSELAGG